MHAGCTTELDGQRRNALPDARGQLGRLLWRPYRIYEPADEVFTKGNLRIRHTSGS